jgi:hypothetical protein
MPDVEKEAATATLGLFAGIPTAGLCSADKVLRKTSIILKNITSILSLLD